MRSKLRVLDGARLAHRSRTEQLNRESLGIHVNKPGLIIMEYIEGEGSQVKPDEIQVWVDGDEAEVTVEKSVRGWKITARSRGPWFRGANKHVLVAGLKPAMVHQTITA